MPMDPVPLTGLSCQQASVLKDVPSPTVTSCEYVGVLYWGLPILRGEGERGLERATLCVEDWEERGLIFRCKENK